MPTNAGRLIVLVSPVINSWYLLWLLPFACVYRNLTAWVTASALLLSYATGLNLGDGQLPAYNHPLWLRPLEYALIGIVGWHEYWPKAAKWLKKVGLPS